MQNKKQALQQTQTFHYSTEQKASLACSPNSIQNSIFIQTNKTLVSKHLHLCKLHSKLFSCLAFKSNPKINSRPMNSLPKKAMADRTKNTPIPKRIFRIAMLLVILVLVSLIYSSSKSSSDLIQSFLVMSHRSQPVLRREKTKSRNISKWIVVTSVNEPTEQIGNDA